LLNAKVELYDVPTGQALQTETENALTGIKWSASTDATMPPVSVVSEQSHYLRISASQFSEEVSGRFYRCFIVVSDLSPPT
jgi:hypothetical protein